jgi:hypothetical protein
LQWRANGFAVVLMLASVLTVDYSAIGVALVVGAWLWFKRRDALGASVLALAVWALCAVNGNAWALVGVACVALAGLWRAEWPRVPWLFWIGYPAHLAVLAAIQWQ